MTKLSDRFTNEPMLDFADPATRSAAASGLADLDRSLPRRAPVWIGDEKLDGEEFASPDPCRFDRIVSHASQAAPNQVSAAVERASEAGRAWSRTPVRERAEILLTAADILRERRAELNSLLVRECGKTWVEADAELVEAVDFLELYARAAVDLDERGDLLELAGERNTRRYAPRGVTGVIGPWNFPLAIPLGMSGAALATGNTVVLKPAEQTPTAGLAIVEVLRAAGVPADAIALLPGDGRVGEQMVAHPLVETISFTGSMAVGLDIIERAGRTGDLQVEIKRVIAEMGGKNCVIVDRDADLEVAAAATVASAFPFAGQKCSAASRALVQGDVYDAFSERVASLVSALRVGAGEDDATDVTAMIDAEAHARVAAYQERAIAEGELVARAPSGPEGGWFLPPTVVRELPADAALLREEAFGPLLTLERYGELDEALGRLNALPYALTGGVFSRSREVIDRVVDSSPVGNLYINRKTTGAIVGRQPFGGNRRSGIGLKAGQADYVLQFVNERVVAEAL